MSKTNKTDFALIALESAKPIKGSPNLMLLKGEGFVNCPAGHTSCVEHGEYDKVWIRDNIPTGVRFYYSLEQYTGVTKAGPEALKYVEQGIGYTEVEGDDLLFIRETPILGGNSPETIMGFSPNVVADELDPELSMSVSSMIPPSYQLALAAPHCVIASVAPFVPTPIPLEENTLLGRKDNRVQSIDKDELLEMLTTDAIIDTVTKNKNQMTLSSRRVNLTRKDSVVSAPIIRPYPPYKNNEKPKTQKGAIIYNESTDCLEYYTGSEWRVLAWSSSE